MGIYVSSLLVEGDHVIVQHPTAIEHGRRGRVTRSNEASAAVEFPNGESDTFPRHWLRKLVPSKRIKEDQEKIAALIQELDKAKAALESEQIAHKFTKRLARQAKLANISPDENAAHPKLDVSINVGDKFESHVSTLTITRVDTRVCFVEVWKPNQFTASLTRDVAIEAVRAGTWKRLPKTTERLAASVVYMTPSKLEVRQEITFTFHGSRKGELNPRLRGTVVAVESIGAHVRINKDHNGDQTYYLSDNDSHFRQVLLLPEEEYQNIGVNWYLQQAHGTSHGPLCQKQEGRHFLCHKDCPVRVAWETVGRPK